MKNPILLLSIFLIIGCTSDSDVTKFNTSEAVLLDSNGKEIFLNESPQNFSITANVYALELKWTKINDSRIDAVQIFKGKHPEEMEFFKSLPNSSNFIDFLVGVREEYFYKIRYVAGDHFTGFSETISAFAEEPLNTNVPINDEIGGIQYAYWDFPFQTFEQISHQFIIHEEPTNENGNANGDGLYYQFYQGILNDTIGFYYGIQTRVYKPGVGFERGIIFSRWSTRNKENYSLSENAWGESAGYEGDFIGISKHYPWKIGQYQTLIKKDSTDTIGDWYSLKIINLSNHQIEYIGSLRFEKSSKSSGIKSGGITWTELYGKEPRGTPLPNWRVSVDEVTVNDSIYPSRVYIPYNPQRFLKFSNSYTTTNKNVYFLMGPNVTRVNDTGYLWDTLRFP